MIAFIGDVHRAFARLAAIVDRLPAEVGAVVQVGDLGLRPSDLEPPDGCVLRLARPMYFISGNHDYEPSPEAEADHRVATHLEQRGDEEQRGTQRCHGGLRRTMRGWSRGNRWQYTRRRSAPDRSAALGSQPRPSAAMRGGRRPDAVP